MNKFRTFRIVKRVRDFLFSYRSREFGVFLFFLAVSAGFWLLQTLDETYENEVEVPIALVDVPTDVVITTPLPENIRVTIRDKGTTLVRYWNHKFDTLRLSHKTYSGGRIYGRTIIPHFDVVEALQERLIGGTKVVSFTPDTLVYYYNHGLHATIPVRVMGDIETDSHYYLLGVKTEPSDVLVYASSNILDTLTGVPTAPVNLKDLRENTSVEVALAPVRGSKAEPQKVKLTALVDVYMENTVDVPIVSLNFPGDRQLRTFPSAVQVTYTVGYTRNREITRDKFVSVVTYEEILDLQKQGKKKIPIRLKSIPDGVSNVRIQPQEVDYLVETVSEED